MAKLFLTTTALLALSAVVHAQAPPPQPEDDVVRISTNVVQLDVSVVDKNGNSVTDLRSEDLEIFENGKRQHISGFSFVSKASIGQGNSALQKTAPVPGQPQSSGPTRRVIALVVDDISLSFESSRYVRQAVHRFIDEQMAEGDLVAILKTGVSTGFLQQFTADKDLLRSAADTIRWNPAGNGGITALAEKDENVKTSDSERDREDALANASLQALNQMIKGMSVLPGRKSAIFFSDGFSLLVRNESGFVDTSRVLESIRKITDSANRSSVVVYTVDARGLQPASFTAADKPGSIEASAGLLAGRRQELAETQDGLRVLAKEAGGFAVLNTNSLSKGIDRILDDQSYYLVAYEPDENTFDAKASRFNRIEIRVKREGLTARYRSGFFNQTTVDKQVATGKASSLTSALISPFVRTEIDLRLQSLYAKDASANQIVRTLLHIPGSDLTFAELPNGKVAVEFDILAVSFASDGLVAEQLARSYKIEGTNAGRAKLLRDGIVYYFTFPIARPGAYQYRVAVRDRATGRIGTAGQLMDVPDERKRQLTLSGIGLENMTKEEFAGDPDKTKSDFLRDTSLRRFSRGSILIYGAEAYRERIKQLPGATWQLRLYREGKLVLNGSVSPLTDQTKDRSTISGALELSSSLEPGEYILQLTVQGKPGDKKLVATQAVSFEIID